MIVKVKYKGHGGEFTSTPYAYSTELPLEVGDIVIAPTYKGDSVAMVVETHIMPEALPANVLRVLREITEYATEESDND